MEFDFSNMTNEEIEARAAAIADEVNAEGADLEALREEARAIKDEREARAAEAARAEIRKNIADGAGDIVRNLKEENKMPENRTYNASSPEYRSAWLKDLAVRKGDGLKLLGDMTVEERDAFTHTTANSGAVVPTVTLNRIIDLVNSSSPIYDDATPMGMSQGFAVPRRKRIVQGDASTVTEGTANDDEENEFDLVPLSGVEIKKHVVITFSMKFKSIDAFEDWLVAELAARISVAKEQLTLARLDGTAPTGGSAVPAAGIDANNVKSNVAKTDAGIRGLLALLKGTGSRVIYANTNTIWNTLAGLENTSGQKLFIPSPMADPVTQGVIYGAVVKLDDNLADNVIYGVVNKQLVKNDFMDLMVFSSLESKTGNTIITGLALTDAGMLDPKGAFKATFAA